MHQFKKILIIQTAFIGDVILATALIEKLHQHFPEARIDFLLRKGNEGLVNNHPYLHEVLIWNKKSDKLVNLFKMCLEIRKNQYDLVVNLQRFLSSGLFAGLSRAKKVVGFKKNPLSFMFHESMKHQIGDGTHEVDRNLQLVASYTNRSFTLPKLHLANDDLERVKLYQEKDYITIAPTSVWFTKQLPKEKWIAFIQHTAFEGDIYLLGSPEDFEKVEEIKVAVNRQSVINLCGKLSLLQSAALMQKAKMNYMNDSAPQHLASAVDAPTCVVFCSTVPDFGFGPLSTHSIIVETTQKLDCRPCGLHGHKSCPEGHFNCAFSIETSSLESAL